MADIRESEQNLTTIVNAVRIIDVIKRSGGATVQELCSHLDMPMSTIHDYVVTLSNAHYLTRDGDVYQLSLKFFEYGIHAKNTFPIVDIATPTIERIAEETGETVWLTVEEQGQLVLLEEAKGGNAVPMEAKLGDRVPIHTVAAGKAILAHRPAQYVTEIIEEYGLPARTEKTITDESTLLTELEEIRSRGVAVNRQESIEGLRDVAAPIQSKEGVVAAISIAGPANRLTDETISDTLAALLLEASNEIELRLEYS